MSDRELEVLGEAPHLCATTLGAEHIRRRWFQQPAELRLDRRNLAVQDGVQCSQAVNGFTKATESSFDDPEPNKQRDDDHFKHGGILSDAIPRI